MLEEQRFEPEGRLAQFLRIASDFDKADIGFAIDTLIARLDAAAGDPDLEDGGDELDDPGDLRDHSWFEWTDRLSQTHGFQFLEDEEDDDPAEEAHS